MSVEVTLSMDLKCQWRSQCPWISYVCGGPKELVDLKLEPGLPTSFSGNEVVLHSSLGLFHSDSGGNLKL
jgi:hypothetical protein